MVAYSYLKAALSNSSENDSTDFEAQIPRYSGVATQLVSASNYDLFDNNQ